MAQNRKYTLINYEQVVNDLQKILRAKEGPLADFGESAYGKTIIELFAGNTDLMASFAEAAFENAFLETATNVESIYLASRALGYSLRRPVPAKAGIGIQLKRTGVYPTVKVNIPKGAKFSISSTVMTAIDDMEFIYDRTSTDYENGLMTLVSGRAVLAEGTFLTVDYFSNGNQNQEFVINDPKFSDYFGFGDPNWIEPDKFSQRKNRFTTITSDASLMDNFDPANAINDQIYWRVSRRGLQDPAINDNVNSIDNFIQSVNKTTNYTVLIDTANDGRARLQFGDGLKSAIPFGKISVTYFSTNGEQGNLLNVAGSTVISSPGSVLITQLDGSESDLSVADLNIALVTDVRGGLNIESIESVKKNASQIYNSLDSLNNRTSYKTFLSRYSDIKYANAFGEDILTRMKSNKTVDLKYSNIVRFTALKDLYRSKDNTYYPTDSVEYYVDGYKVNGLIYVWQYDFQDLPSKKEYSNTNVDLQAIQSSLQSDIDAGRITIKIKEGTGDSYTQVTDSAVFIKNYMGDVDYNTALIPDKIFSSNLQPLDFAEDGSELETLLNSLNRRGYITLGGGQHMYVPPIVHDFTVKMDVTLFKGQNFSDIKTKIRNNIYAYLKEYTEFASPMFRSKLESIVQAFPEVAGVNLRLVPRENPYSKLDLSRLTWLGDNTSQFINQSNLSFKGVDCTLNYDYRYLEMSGASKSEYNKSITFSIGLQDNTAGAIQNYYKSYIAYYNASLGKYVPKTNLTEEVLNKFTAFIWATMMNNVYVPLFDKYKKLKSEGNVLEANAVYNVMEAIKGWYENDGYLSFKNTDSILNMTEDTSNSIYNYFKYTIEYIKLVRNVLSPIIASRLVDSSTGNITGYTNENEIVQFNISSEDIQTSVEHDSIIMSRK